MGNCLCCCVRENLSLKVSNFYDITMKNIDDQTVSFEEFRNKVLVIVNIACK